MVFNARSTKKGTRSTKIIAFPGGYPYPEPMTIGEKIKKYRLTHGLTLPVVPVVSEAQPELQINSDL